MPHDVEPNTKYQKGSASERLRKMIQSRRARGVKDDEGWSAVTVGWEPGCEHDAETKPAVALDPFAGSGTTGVVALRHGRSFVGIELSAEYALLGRQRIISDAPLLNAGIEGTRE